MLIIKFANVMKTKGKIKIVIEGRPFTVNKQYTNRKGTRQRLLTSEAKSYGDRVGWQARQQYRGKPLDCDLEVSYFYYFSDNRKCDHLNFNKILNDRMNQIVWMDDRQIKVSHHYTMLDRNNPRVEVIIEKLEKGETNGDSECNYGRGIVE